ncbi:1,2-phenylacetyl-CoA epoxidase subunit PaaE [Corynebacterium epidermidicanis]|uniref:Flavodoxin reductase family protein n=1 Tax=Corynebacterium epidermidicanis TaxID=1050174 RepID=A0A0G3GUS6_9CORY|nr:1,2-phenylacetyl-CoA epoxidase subunit PaaE [Corynebacterium epidermidicanis]AKK04265.1 flavodoxin reductase family protein [Corynebacterium epidermidicanis]
MNQKVKFNPLRVSEIRRLTPDSVEVSFEVPTDLADDYNYIPGQYVALRREIDGQEVRRSYSICATPQRLSTGASVIKVGIKKNLGGVFSTWANDALQVGDTIDVMNPQGAFTSRTHVTFLNDPAAAGEGKKHLVAVAAGSGITPIMAIASAFLASAEDHTFELIYANKGAGDVMFAEEIGDLKDKYPARFAVHHVLSRENRVNPLFTGRIDGERLEQLLDNVLGQDADEWFLCGPFELVQLCRDALAERGVPEDRVRFELFATGKPADAPGGQQGRAVEIREGEDVYKIKFTLDGLTGEVDSPVSAHETVLNAALRKRSDVPFACAGGVCGTCRARVVEGEYEMDENYALEPDEVERGYVLTCQTRPTSPCLTVDFDS